MDKLLFREHISSLIDSLQIDCFVLHAQFIGSRIYL